MDINKTIGLRIKEIRKIRSLTTSELGALSGTSQSTISLIERGERSPQVDTLLKICEALQITIVDVLPEELKPQELEQNISTEVGLLLRTLKELPQGEASLLINSIRNTESLPLLQAFLSLSDTEKKLLNEFLNSIMNNASLRSLYKP